MGRKTRAKWSSECNEGRSPDKTYQIDELGKMETETDSDDFAVVTDGPYEPVVMTEQIIVESFSVGIGRHSGRRRNHQESDGDGSPAGHVV